MLCRRCSWASNSVLSLCVLCSFFEVTLGFENLLILEEQCITWHLKSRFLLLGSKFWQVLPAIGCSWRKCLGMWRGCGGMAFPEWSYWKFTCRTRAWQAALEDFSLGHYGLCVRIPEVRVVGYFGALVGGRRHSCSTLKTPWRFEEPHVYLHFVSSSLLQNASNRRCRIYNDRVA